MALMRVIEGNMRHRRLAELIEAFDRHSRAGLEAEAAGRQVEAVLAYRAQIDLRKDMCAEAMRLGLPLPATGWFIDDLAVMRSFVAGGGWQ